MPEREEVQPNEEPEEEPSDGPEGRPPSEDEVFDRASLMPKEYRDGT